MTRTRKPGRRLLIIVAVVFLAPFVAALVLHRIGWHPDATRNQGELVDPPQPLSGVVLHDRQGEALPLANPERRFTWLVQLPATCSDDCLQRLDEIHRVRYSLGRHAPKLAVRLIGTAPVPELPASLAALDAGSGQVLAAAWNGFGQARPWSGWLVDDKGFVMLHFPAGMEARLIRRDLARLVK